ncbi:9195_t:CDS:2, partial [Scutellospora calospora]
LGKLLIFAQQGIHKIRPLVGIPIIEQKLMSRLQRAVEVAAFLFEIFTTFGPPLILQLHNGKEPRHPTSQGSVQVEFLNQS